MFHGEHEGSSAFFFIKNNNPRVTEGVIRIHIYVTTSSLILPYGGKKTMNLVSLLLLLFIKLFIGNIFPYFV